MKFKSQMFFGNRGFTVVEMLTVVAVIGILVSLLIPAINVVQNTAKDLKQKAQFASIEVALESFYNDQGDYPDSTYSNVVNYTHYGGAQKLAEAMVGLDGFGFNPDSVWRPDGMDDAGAVDLYDSTSYKDRNERYLELETSNVTKIDDIYSSLGGFVKPGTYVLTDMYGKVDNINTGKKVGMPILYFRAYVQNTNFPTTAVPYDGSFVSDLDFVGGSAREYIYCYSDNNRIVDLDAPFDSEPHPLKGDEMIFYDAIASPDFPGVPYKSDSYILLSAGRDGYYGTEDDVYNFNPPKY